MILDTISRSNSGWNRKTVDNMSSIINGGNAVSTKDSYMNIAANLGAFSSNISNAGGYVLERFTWDYWTLNILYRNNWIAKAIIDKPANEIMKNGFKIQSQISPDKTDKIMQIWYNTKTNKKFLQCLKWARLFGGCILVPMIANQPDMEKPLDYDEIMPDSYKGCFLVDRWSGVNPSSELVTDINDPEFGKPMYYDISDEAIRKTVRIHHSRIIKMIGRSLPYWEEIAENWWGASELEHVFEELRKRDNTSANIAFLIFLANIRVFKMNGLGQMITLGDQEALQTVYNTMQQMNNLMCNTGTMAVDNEDSFEEHQYSFSGINDVYESFMLDISGAAEIPVDKLFGRAPSGFNSGEETLQNYYDTIQEKQETDAKDEILKLIRIISVSAIGKLPDDLTIEFNPVRRPSTLEKADLASRQAQPIFDAFSGGLIGKATALKELRDQTDVTGLWSNITDEMINEAIEEDKENKENEKNDINELQSLAGKLTNGNINDKMEDENEKAKQSN